MKLSKIGALCARSAKCGVFKLRDLGRISLGRGDEPTDTRGESGKFKEVYQYKGGSR